MPGEPDASRLRDVRLHGSAVTGPRLRHGCGAACFVALMPVHPVVRLGLPAPSCRRGREGCPPRRSFLGDRCTARKAACPRR